MKRARCLQTDDLLSWSPPEQVAATFEDKRHVQGHTIDVRVALAVSKVLKYCADDRESVARKMTEFLGVDVSKSMLDAYASQSRKDHPIGFARAVALLHATGDARLFGAFLEECGWAVIPANYMGAVEEAIWSDREAEAKRKREASRRKWKSGS